MRTVLIGLIALALLAAGGTVYFVKEYFSEQKAEQDQFIAERLASKTKILVTDRALPAGSTVTSGDLRWQPWPEEGVESDFIVEVEGSDSLEKQFVGSIVKSEIDRGVPITASKVFKRSNSGFMAGKLASGMRAVSIPINAAKSASGFIRPGDRVDVVMTLDIQREGDSIGRESGLIGGRLVRYVAETVLRNVRILAIDQNLSESDDNIKVGKTATLEVTPRQAEVISVSARMGDLSLVLRSLALDEQLDKETSFTTDLEVSPSLLTLFRGEASDTPAASAPMPVIASSQPSHKRRITIYRGSQATTETF